MFDRSQLIYEVICSRTGTHPDYAANWNILDSGPRDRTFLLVLIHSVIF
jgi:hypothetical protein